jgi:hypothetical protein
MKDRLIIEYDLLNIDFLSFKSEIWQNICLYAQSINKLDDNQLVKIQFINTIFSQTEYILYSNIEDLE